MRKRTHERIVAEYERLIEHKDNEIEFIAKTNKAHLKEIKGLLDRLMSRNWEQFYRIKEIEALKDISSSEEYKPEEDENNAGKIINIPSADN
jgi:sulfatase maturation enzyme AslB (radical SAM superfamily)